MPHFGVFVLIGSLKNHGFMGLMGFETAACFLRQMAAMFTQQGG
jgi:hypothetical protein